MRKRVLKTVIATVVCVMLMGGQVFASSTLDELGTSERGQDQEVTGDSSLMEPIFRVIVPTTFEFAIDAFKQGGQSQIYSADFPIINKSNVDIGVDVKMSVDAKTAGLAIIKNSAADVAAVTDDEKAVYFGVAVPKVVAAETVTPVTADPTVGNDSYWLIESTTAGEDDAYVKVAVTTDIATTKTTAENYAKASNGLGYTDATATIVKDDVVEVNPTFDYADATSYVETALSATEKTVSFALKKADYVEYYYDDGGDLAKGKLYKNIADDQSGSTVFRFVGAVNTKADFVTAALKATAKYNFKGMSEADYTAAKATFSGHALINAIPSYTETGTANYASGVLWLGPNVNAVTDVTNLVISKNGGAPVMIPATNLTVASKFLNISKAELIQATGDSSDLLDTATYYLYYTLGGKDYRAEIQFT